MAMTAERLEETPSPRGVRWSKVAIGVLPLVAALAYLFLDGDKLIAMPERTPAPEVFAPVAVALVASEAPGRMVPVTARVEAEMMLSLRAEEASQVLAMSVRSGQRVAEGQQVCRLSPVSGADETVLFSPISGIVHSVHGAPGSFLESGAPCAMVMDPSSLIAKAAFPPRYAEIIQPGDRVTLTHGGKDYISSVRIIYPSRDGRGVEEQPFEVAIPPELELRPGAEVGVSIDTNQVIPTLVPFEALSMREGGGMGVRIVEGTGPTGTVSTIRVRIVARSDDGIYVEGIPSEARLVLQGTEFGVPEDGERVRIGRVK